MIQKQTWAYGTRILIVLDGHNASVMLDIPLCTNNEAADGIIYALWVEPSERKQKLATILLAKAEIEAKLAGCESVQLEWDGADTPEWVLEWYKRKGYTYGKNKSQLPSRCYLIKKL